MAQEAQAAAEDTAALPVDNGDVGNHVVEGKGIGLEAAAGAAAEQEEAIKDAKSSGVTLPPFSECITASKEDTTITCRSSGSVSDYQQSLVINIHSHV